MNALSTRRRRFPWFGWLAVALLWGVIVVIVYPVFYIPHSDSPRSTCANNLHQIGLAMMCYSSDWGDRMPILRTERQQTPDGQAWPDLIRKYIKSESIFICPKSPKGHLSYAFNRRVSGRMPGSDEIDISAEVVTAYDSVNDRPEFNNLNGDTVWRYQDGGMPQPGQYVPWDGPVNKYTARWPKWAKPRHEGGNSVLFADGHVKWMEPTDIPRFEPKLKEE